MDTIYSRFGEQVRRAPEAVAVTTDSGDVTYARLNALSDAVMRRLEASPGERIGIVMSHGVTMIAAMLGVLRSGAAYVPAEPSLPQARISYMMANAGVKLIITDDFFNDLEAPEEAGFDDRSKPDDIAYILYTSGTTGHPKGVMVENHSVVNYAEAFEYEFHTSPGDVMLQFSVCSFDIFVEEVFTTLLNGAALAIPSAEVHDGGIDGLMEFCRRRGVTEISGFPYLLADMNRRDVDLPALRLLISGGDVIRSSYISRLRHKPFMIYNTYGPSETTVCCTYYRVDNAPVLDDGTFPVGKAVSGAGVVILDERLQPVAPGQTGEICITGAGVARGYVGNPPEQSNFVTMPDGTRMYRSGDLGYEMPDGNIGFLRRKDDQVMIMGRRVEPDEVENVLNESPCVERAVVRPFTDDNGLSYLVAYLVPSHKRCRLGDIRQWLRSRLVDYMIPEFFVSMDEIPLTPNGKVDFKALPVVMKEGGEKCA